MKVAEVVAPGASTARAHAGPIADRLMSPVAKFCGHVVEKKGDCVFHFEGAGYVVTYKSATGEVYPAYVRLLRGLPSAPGKKENLGVAVKGQRPNGDQDLEMVSSLLTFRAAVDRGPVTANLPADLTTPVDATGPSCGKESFNLTLRSKGVAAALQNGLIETITDGMVGYDQPMGRVTVDMDHPLTAEQNAALEFNPYNDAGGIKPVGGINALRKLVYKASQLGRRAPSDAVLPSVRGPEVVK